MMIAVKLDPKSIKVRPDTGKIFFTYSDLEKLPEYPEGPLVEVIGGDLFVVPSPTVTHQRISQKIEQILILFVTQNNLGEVFHAPIDVLLEEEEAVVPDIIFVSRARASIIGDKNVHGSPDLVVEIVSENRQRDYVKKRQVYEAHGVKEYWVVDPVARTIGVFLYDAKKHKFLPQKVYSQQDILPVKTIVGLSFPVQQIF